MSRSRVVLTRRCSSLRSTVGQDRLHRDARCFYRFKRCFVHSRLVGARIDGWMKVLTSLLPLTVALSLPCTVRNATAVE